MPKKAKKPRFKFLIYAMGSGETSHAIAFGHYARENGAKMALALRRKANLPYLDSPEDKKMFYRVQVTESPADLIKMMREEKPDALLLFNSKSFKAENDWVFNAPLGKPLTFSLDTNWLFSEDPEAEYRYVRWIDKFLIVMPPAVFKYGLKKYGGAYDIPERVMKNLKVTGLMPSYKPVTASVKRMVRAKYGVLPGEKLIFGYAGYARTNQPEAVKKLFPAAQQIWSQKNKIKVIYIGEGGNIPAQYRGAPWLVHLDELDSDEFYKILASSDLVYQHQGLGTMAQAISARIPIIANVHDLPKMPVEHTHAWEVGPFEKAGVCKMFYFGDSLEPRVKEILSMLYEGGRRRKILAAQKKLYSRGEEAAYKEIISEVKKLSR